MSGQTTSNPTVNATATAAVAAVNPNQVVGDVLSAAHAALSDTSGFYAAAANDPSITNFITESLSGSNKEAFLAAYANHTLSLQSAANVAGWQPGSQTTLTGTSETTQPINQVGSPPGVGQPQQSANSTVIDFGIGQLYISWPVGS